MQLQSLSSCSLPGLQAACAHCRGQPGKQGQQSSALVLRRELRRWTLLTLSKSGLLGCRQQDAFCRESHQVSI